MRVVGVKMNKLVSTLKINETKINSVQHLLKKNVYTDKATLLYQGQLPVSAIFIHQGQVSIVKRNKVKKVIGPGYLIVFDEFINKLSLKFDVEVEATTIISWLSLDVVQGLISNQGV